MKRNSIIFMLIIVLVGIVTLTSYKSKPQQITSPSSTEAYAILRTTEIYGMKPSSMVTIYADGTVEKNKLGKLNANLMEENLLIIHSKIEEIINKGYTLVSTTGGNSDNIICMTFVFKKTQN